MSYNPANAWPASVPAAQPAQPAAGYDYSQYYAANGQYYGQYPGFDAAYYQQYYGTQPPAGTASAQVPSGAGHVPPPLPPPGEPPASSSAGPHPPAGAPPAAQPGGPQPPAGPPPAGAGGQGAAPSTTDPAAAGYDYSQYYAQYYAQYGYPQQGQAVGQYPPPAGAPPAGAYPYSYPSGQRTGAAPSPVPPPRPPSSGPPHTGAPSPRAGGHGAYGGHGAHGGGTGANIVPVGGGGHGTYTAVPPPSSLTPQQRGGQPVTIRPQYAAGARKSGPGQPGGPSYAAVAAGATNQQQPAFVRAGGPGAGTRPGQQQAGGGSKPGGGSGGAPSKFPPSFTAWVERCFARCRIDSERQAMTAKLTVRIKEVESSGRMWLVDWDTEAVPNVGQTGGDSLPSPSATGGDAVGLRSKRSRWAESENAAAGERARQAAVAQQQAGKRRKKVDAGDDGGAAQPWARGENAKRAARMGRFGDGRAQGGVQAWRGAATGRGRNYSYDEDEDEDEEFDLSSVIIQGTCTELEKSYFRLTAAPDPAVVRPEHILRRALDRLVGLMRDGSVNYFYACDQLKGLRQDCTVQHLRNELVVEVYEAHARASLEYGDLAEFNQCQTQLAGLYAEGIRGARAEFMAYKLLYNTAHARAGANKALLHTLRGALALVAECGADTHGAVANALAARKAAFAADLPSFFAAYAAAPALGRVIMDLMAKKLRWVGLNVLVKSYKAPLPVSFIAPTLGFCPVAVTSKSVAPVPSRPLPGCKTAVYVGKASAAATDKEGVEACIAWLQAHGAVVDTTAEGGPVLDVKSSLGKLFVPEEPKVSHGDENLSLEDFLARASRATA